MVFIDSNVPMYLVGAAHPNKVDAQRRLEALVNFQTMVCDLTGMAIANASMLDEATAAAEAMALALRVGSHESRTFFVAADVLPQTLDVVRTRAEPLGYEVKVVPAGELAAVESLEED
jgi:glycine dehydrogenase